MEVKKIYFDMDGVLADFGRGIEELCGLKFIDQTKQTHAQMDEMFEAMRKVPHFYDHLKMMDGAFEMFELIRKEYGDKVEILSGIPKPKRGIENSKDDKINWIHRLLGEDVVVNIVYREEKIKYCTGPDCILIDDYPKNIKEWNELGGTGIVHVNSRGTLAALKALGVL